MKILFPPSAFFPSQTGGTNNSVYWLAKALKQQSFDVITVTTDEGIDKEIPLDTWLVKDCGLVRYCKTIFRYLPVSQIFHAGINISRIKIIHLSSLFYPPSLLLAFWGIIFKKKNQQ